MEDFFGRYVLGGLVPFLLIGMGIFFLIYLGFFFIIKPKKTFSSLVRKRQGGDVSQFGALTVALAGTLGVGNIVGVSSAIILGGAGSVFWMWVSALAAMVLKYGEIVLAHRHRKIGETGLRGGAMYYIEDFFGGRFGKALGGIFALLCLINSLSMGSMLQANTVGSAAEEIFHVSPVIVGAVLALICAVVIFRNIHNISPLTSVIIPVMTLTYVIMSSVVIWRFRSGVGDVFSIIFRDAFSYRSASGGIFGFMLSSGIRYGCMRGLLSNEAGCGTAPIAHAASGASLAAEQGVWGIIEVFIDTILLCTLTALSILLTNGLQSGDFSVGDEMKLVISSYGEALGPSSAPLLLSMVFFFAFATIICWAYYGTSTLEYLSYSRSACFVFKVIYVASVFIGSCRISGVVWQVSDFALGCMTVINLIMLFLMRKEIKEETGYLMR
ncbi:MAG: sodium:alanine symporter family protein [Ruminococcaceae bacterium]|nr:sodium:alanine symporter family protein [Oscillospiraceae bacterium]